jgi:succinate dehydrogenase / fumarate reductase cytochrome b subunit
MLDGYQKEAEKAVNTKIDLPVFHLPQLLGLALGMDPDALMLKRNMVRTVRVLDRIQGV